MAIDLPNGIGRLPSAAGAFLLALSLLFLCLPAPLAAKELSPQSGLTYGELTQAQRVAFIESLVLAGKLDEAQRFLAHSRFNEGDTGYRAALLQAIIFKQRGDLAAAETLLRKILDERPVYSGVRLELAEVLALRGNREGASHHLQLLADTAGDDATRDRFERFIDRINPERPFQFGGFVSIAPSSNINNGAGGSSILIGGLPYTIGRKAQAQSGLGIRAGVNAAYTHRLTESLSAYLAGSAVASEYSGGDFDIIAGDLRAGLRHSTGSRILGAELIADRRWIALQPVDWATGVRLFTRQPLAPRLLFSGELQFARRNYDGIPTARLDTFNGKARLTYAPSARMVLHAEAGMTHEEAAARPHNSWKGGYVEAGATMVVGMGITASVALRGGIADYEGPYPLLGFARRDEAWEIRASLLKRDLVYAGFSPRLTLTYAVNDCNVALHEYDKYGAELTFTKEF